MAGTQPVEVFVEDDVEHPVQPVLDVPVRANGACEQFGVERLFISGVDELEAGR